MKSDQDDRSYLDVEAPFLQVGFQDLHLGRLIELLRMSETYQRIPAHMLRRKGSENCV